MKNNLKKLLIGLMIFTSITTGSAFAGDSFSIQVSCSIPEVPGLNAPPIKEETKGTPTEAEIIAAQNESQEQTPLTIQEDTEREIMLADRSTSSEITKTIYSR